MSQPRTIEGRELTKFVDSPTRKDASATEVYLGNSFDIVSELKKLSFQIEKLNESLNIPKENNFTLQNGFGNGQKAKITPNGALKVSDQRLPDADDDITEIPLSGFLSDVNGNIDARVDGSVTPIDFYIEADQNQDIYLSSISFKIADQNAQLNNFGNINALTNGFQLIYFSSITGERILADNIQSNFDLIRLCQGLPAFSQGVESFRASNVVGGSEGYIPVLRITDNFGLPYGLRLKAGTFDKLILRIRDDVTGVDAFDIFYYGIQKI